MYASFYSSFVFITNILISIIYKNYAYSYYFLLLICTSLAFHYDRNIYTYYLDQLSVLLIVLYGGGQFFKKYVLNWYNIVIIICFITTILIYYLNTIHKNIEFWHVLIHIITCIGHNFIVIQ
jgi:hypothetical protein